MSLTSGKQLLLTSAAGGGGYEVSRSLRFNSADSAYLSRTPASAGNRKTWTWAGWVKRSEIGGASPSIWGCQVGAGNPRDVAQFPTDKFAYEANTSGSSWNVSVITTQVFRDASAWYHFVLAVDTTQATAADRIKIFVNGSQITSFSTATYPSQNADLPTNQSQIHYLGASTGANYFNGYLADIHFIDGQALDPTSFGEFDANGIWQPIEYTASGPNNGTTWSNTLSATGGVTNASNAFNGDLSTAALSVTDNASLIFDASSYSLSGTVRVFTPAIASGCVLRISANGGAYIETTSNSAQWTNLGNVGNISEIRVAINPANPADIKTPLAAIEVNGVVLINGNTSNIGVNGFHLEFADNSSNTATTLGKDTSGNGNNWTPNNFTVAAPAYSAPTNNNTPVYEITIGATNPLSGTYVWSNAFDGTTSTTGLIGPITFTGTKPTWSTSTGVELMADGNGITASVNGGSYVSLTNNAYVTISSGSSGTLNTIYIDSPTSASYIKSVRVDGVDISVKALIGSASDIDSLVDVPTNGSEVDTGSGGQVRGNYCTWNPLKNPGGNPTTFSNGNLETTFAFGGVNFPVPMGTFGVSTGKWYWEITPTSGASGSGGMGLGIGTAACGPTNAGALGVTANGWAYYYSGNKYNNNNSSAYGASYTNNDVIGVALDCDNGTLVFYKNGVSQGTAYTGLTTGPYFPAVGNSGDTTTCVLNAGQRPFAYTAPSGFKALCTANLPAPVVTKPSTVFDVLTWTGDGSSSARAISGLNFLSAPDFVWIKNRSSAYSHTLYDVIRGPGPDIALASNTTGAEGSLSDGATFGYLSAFNSTGFSIVKGTDSTSYVNGSGQAYAAWCWDAGSSTVTDNTGSIQSSRRTNASAGISIVSYTGTGSAGTVGHGLGVAPSLIITKPRSAGNTGWTTYHRTLGKDQFLQLQATNAAASSSGVWGSAEPTSTVFGLGAADNNYSGATIIAYCFAPVAGYSSFGSYTGNGSADGPFVFCGFRPRWVLIKWTSGSNAWLIIDTARDPYNVSNKNLNPNDSSAENTAFTGSWLDHLSNGFKIRNGADSAINANAGSYIYAAFAESPFQYARAR